MESPHANSLAKRPAPDADNGRSKKRRSSRACLSCRSRKVRCDVAISGVPCNNCRLDNIDCQLRASNRGRKPAAPVPISEEADSLQSVQNAELSHPPTPESTSPANQLPVSLTFEEQVLVPRPEDQVNGGSVRQQPSPDSSNVDIGGGTGATYASSTDYQTPSLPCYIRPLASHIPPEDVEFLERKDALTIPDVELRNELLRIYVQVVYPFMPAIELDELLTPIVQADGKNPVSLLLFQAVMFVGVAFVKMDYLRTRGFESRRIARRTFFNRARILHNLECEPDRLVKLQALLLMTYWYDGPDDEKDTWYWTGISLSLAQLLGLHRDQHGLAVSKQVKRLRSRIWWSCFTRDSLLALGIRRPARIRNDEFSVPLLTLDDCVFEPLPEDVMAFLGPSTWLQDTNTCQTIAVASVELIKLCVHLGRILLTQYSVLGSHPVGSEYFTSFMVFPRKSGEQIEDLAKCDAALENWYQNLDASCRYKPFSLSPAQRADENSKLIYLHKATLHMIYLTTIGALHRPQAFLIDADPEDGSPQKIASKRKVSDSAIGITELAYDLQSYNLMRYLSTTSIPALISAILIHLLDTRSTKEDIRNISIGRFYQCMQALEQLRDMYASADYALAFIQTVIRNIGIKIPMLSFGAENSTKIKSPSMNRASVDHRSSALAAPVANTSGPAHQRVTATYPTPTSYTNPGPYLMNMPPTSGPLMEHTQRVLDTFASSTPAPLSLNDMDGMPGNGSWTAVDSLLSAMMTFEPGRNVFPQAMDTEQPWLGDFM